MVIICLDNSLTPFVHYIGAFILFVSNYVTPCGFHNILSSKWKGKTFSTKSSVFFFKQFYITQRDRVQWSPWANFTWIITNVNRCDTHKYFLDCAKRFLSTYRRWREKKRLSSIFFLDRVMHIIVNFINIVLFLITTMYRCKFPFGFHHQWIFFFVCLAPFFLSSDVHHFESQRGTDRFFFVTNSLNWWTNPRETS